MIEVEKKIEASSQFLDYVIQNSVFLGEKLIEDVYYDTADYRYTPQNIWLRKRNNLFELKRSVRGTDRKIDRYEEITDERRILEVLQLKERGAFSTLLQEAEIVSFAQFVTHRKKYLLPSFTIDLDVADFGDFIYRIAEIEKMVESESDVAKAEREIHDFLGAFEMNVKPQAKLSVYLARCRPQHYIVLQKAGVI